MGEQVGLTMAKTSGLSDRANVRGEKEAAARAAVAEIDAGMIVGLGTGSTVAFAISALAERCRSGLSIRAVATSIQTETLARGSGIEIIDFADLSGIDICIDGVDEIDGALRAVKGAGGAMLREKIVAEAALRMIAIADSSKAVDRLGRAAVPVEILPFAREFVRSRTEALGATPSLRHTSASGVYLTDQGNQVLDCAFGTIDDPEALARTLSDIPGIVGHGLFISEIDVLYLARGDMVDTRTRQV